jgi:hypothetical protein
MIKKMISIKKRGKAIEKKIMNRIIEERIADLAQKIKKETRTEKDMIEIKSMIEKAINISQNNQIIEMIESIMKENDLINFFNSSIINF